MSGSRRRRPIQRASLPDSWWLSWNRWTRSARGTGVALSRILSRLDDDREMTTPKILALAVLVLLTVALEGARP